MKKVLFDLISIQPSPEAKFHGGAEYAKSIIIKILTKGYKNLECIYNPNLPIDEKIVERIEGCGIALIKINDKAALKDLIESGKYEKFFSALPLNYYADIDFTETKFYFTIHGLRLVEMPSDIYAYKYVNGTIAKLKQLLKYAFFQGYVKKANINNFKGLLNVKNKKVFTVSNHSKWSLLTTFPNLKEEDVQVCYSPFNFLSDEMIRTVECNYKYFLILSSNRWIKNSYRAMKAFDSLFSMGYLRDVKVVLLGADDLVRNFKVKNQNNFVFKDYVTQEELNNYITNAHCLVYPSLNEGFGYPPVQAMKCKTPSICSGVSSIPEVCGDAVLYFNPYSQTEIENRILQIYYDSFFRKKLIDKSNIRYKDLCEIQDEHLTSMIEELFVN